MMLTGENGILKRAGESGKLDDISQTKELIKLELIEKTSENTDYTNDDVIEAVKKITDKDIEKNAGTVLSKKNNEVDISDLWKKEEQITFTVEVEISDRKMGVDCFTVPKGTTWYQFLCDYESYEWTADDEVEDKSSIHKMIRWVVEYYGEER